MCLTREEIVNCNCFRGLNDYQTRVAVKMRQETEGLLEAFTEVVENSV
jgi:histidinol-phosphate/aromatic aminotransferase/cobyric acid decarboxylase-like protein